MAVIKLFVSVAIMVFASADPMLKIASFDDRMACPYWKVVGILEDHIEPGPGPGPGPKNDDVMESATSLTKKHQNNKC